MKIVSAKDYRPPKMAGFEDTGRVYPVVGIPFSATLLQLSNLKSWTKGALKEWGSYNDARELVTKDASLDSAYSIGFISGKQRGDHVVEKFGDQMYYVYQFVVKPWHMARFKKEALSIGAVFLKVSPEEMARLSI